MIVEVEEETTSEQGRVLDLVPRGRRDQMLTSKELWSARSCPMVTSAVLSHPKSVREQFRGFMFMLRD